MDKGLALVTGGAGFIGSHLVDRLVLEGWRVRILDNFSTGRMENIKHHVDSEVVEVVKGDLKDLKCVEKALEGVEVVFHFAANPEVRVSTTNPEIHFNENVVATFNLLEAMRKRSAREIVFASSSSVYGELENIPMATTVNIERYSFDYERYIFNHMTRAKLGRSKDD
jgi:UDP-glucose 4-epimerase